MSPTSLPALRLRASELLPRRRSRLERTRVALADGARTTLYIASFELGAYRPRVAALDAPTPLARWCKDQGARYAIVGGFFVRTESTPLGELRIAGEAEPSVPFDAPWSTVRACVQIGEDAVRIATRNQFAPEPGGDLLQAGPMLVTNGCNAVAAAGDAEGFSAASHQFDSDITLGRYPRAALALAGERVLAVVCDGRTSRDAGMTLSELADALVDLGAADALNLDGGGSASLVHDGRLRNRPREQHGVDLLDGRPIATAIVFEAR